MNICGGFLLSPNENHFKRVLAGMKSLASLSLIAALATAAYPQSTPPRPEIQGTVVEYGTHLGLSGVQVTLLKNGEKEPVRTTATDSQGAFSLQPDDFGHYTVNVALDGYTFAPPDLSNISASSGAVVLTTGNPKEELHFTLVRPGEITGRVVDEETGEPVAKVRVKGMPSKDNGPMLFLQGMPILTDAEGRFVIANVMPANYVVETLSAALGTAQITDKFSDEEVSQVDRDIEQAFWPGGGDLDSASPIQVASGGSVSVGTLKTRTVPYYRALVRFAFANCPDGAKAVVRLRHTSNGSAPDQVNAQVPCGSDFLIRDIPRGSYEVVIFAGRGETLAQTKVPLEIGDKNVEVFAALERGVDVDVRITVADDVTQPAPEQVTVLLNDRDMLSPNAPFNPGEDGTFKLPNQPLGRKYVEVLRAPNRLYLREVRYNGIAQNENAFDLDGGSQAHIVELVLDNQPGAIRGVVQENDQPVATPCVVAAKWPLSSDMLPSSVHKLDARADGKFTVGGLSPGEYRIFAVSQENKEKLSDSSVLQRLLTSAENVTLDRGSVQNVELKLTDPSR